jgi:hypothetical protein
MDVWMPPRLTDARQDDNVVDWNVVDGTAIPHAAFRRRS